MPDRDTTPTRDTAETGGGEDDHPSIKRQARDAVHEAADAAAEHARQFAVEAKQRVKEKAKEARDALQAHVRERMKEQAVEAADRKRSEIAADVHTVAEALRTASTKIREDGKTDRLTESVACYIDLGAEHVDSASSYLQGRDIGALAEDTKKLVRKYPAVFVAAFAAGGIALAKVIADRDKPRAGSPGGGAG